MLKSWANGDSEYTVASTTLVHRAVLSVQEPVVTPGQAEGHLSRLVVEPGRWTDHDPFLLLAEDWFGPGTFGDHPHRGFETVTLVLEGVLEHRDNRGVRGVLGPGDAQLMTAARGVVHAEEPLTPRVHALQLWLNLPASMKMTEPRYQDLRLIDLPVRRGNGFEVTVYSGAAGGTRAPTRNVVPFTMLGLRVDAGTRLVQDVPGWHRAFLYILAGSGRFGVHRTFARAGQVLWFDNAEEIAPSEITIEAREPLHAVLFAAEPLGEPVAARGPFVMNTLAELQQAYADYREGKF